MAAVKGITTLGFPPRMNAATLRLRPGGVRGRVLRTRAAMSDSRTGPLTMTGGPVSIEDDDPTDTVPATALPVPYLFDSEVVELEKRVWDWAESEASLGNPTAVKLYNQLVCIRTHFKPQ